MMDKTPQKTRVHILIIPFPAPSHTTPLIHLTQRLLHHDNNLTATIVVTPSISSLLQPILSIFPPPRAHPLILSPPPQPPSSDHTSLHARHALTDPIISWCGSHPDPPCLIISDFLCVWTQKLSSCLNVPRVVFYPTGAFGSAVLYSMWRLSPKNTGDDVNFEVVLHDLDGSPRFKWCELSNLFRCGHPGDTHWDNFRVELLSALTSWGAVFNTFSELEKVHLDHFKKEMGHDRVWAVGPLSQDDDVAEDRSGVSQFQEVMTWLDGKTDCSVVYVCFGSRTTLSAEESTVLRAALELSKVHFIWCVQESDGGAATGVKPSDFECDSKTANNGLIIKGWAPQLAILKHRAVGGFVTHWGWNSVIEAIGSGVVMVCWPKGADQYSNAQLVVDRLGLGFRVKCDGSNCVPDPQELAQLLVECVSVTRLERGRVMSLGKVATSTFQSGGSSALDFEKFVKCLNACSLA